MKEKIFFLEKKFLNSIPSDELAQNVSKKSLSDEFFLCFTSKVQNLTVFSMIYMIRIPFFGPGELIQRYFRAARCLLREGDCSDPEIDLSDSF